MSDEKQQSPEDQGFNDSELQDIMQEIESLEKEFTSDESSGNSEDEQPAEVSEAEHPDEAEKGEDKEEKTDLQKAIDKEVEELEMEANMDEMEQALDQAESAPTSEQEEHHEEEDVFSDEDFDEESEAQVTPLSSHPHHSKGMQLKASGQMNLELCFPVGDQEAEFKVLPDGFCVELNGIVVHVDEKKGCHISMPGGAEFSLPLEQAKVKKAS